MSNYQTRKILLSVTKTSPTDQTSGSADILLGYVRSSAWFILISDILDESSQDVAVT